jgi:hypothetical protein
MTRRLVILLILLTAPQVAEARTRINIDIDRRNRPRITRYRTVRRFGWHGGTHYGPYVDGNGTWRTGWHTGTHKDWYTIDLPVLDRARRSGWEMFVKFGKGKRLRARGDSNISTRHRTTIRPMGGKLLSWVDGNGRVLSSGTGRVSRFDGGNGWTGTDLGNSIIMVDTPGSPGVQVFLKQNTKGITKPDTGKGQPKTVADRVTQMKRDKLLDQADQKFARGLYPQAALLYHKAMKLDKTDALARFAVAHSLFALGVYKTAGQNLRVGLDKFPDWGLVNLDLRKFYVKQATFFNKLVALKKYVAARPHDRDARLLLGYAYYFSGQRKAGLSIFKQLVDEPAGDNHAELFLKLAAYELTDAPPKKGG